MGLAGLYETYMDVNGGEIDTACIITTGANALMATVHDRMPAVLPSESFAAWLDCDDVDAASATEMLQPAANDALELVPIATNVNRVANDDASLQAPLGEAIRWKP